jgi:polyphosphate kinase 2
MSDDKHHHYKDQLRTLQIELVKTQIWAMGEGKKVVGVFEGRDAAGKDGAIKRLSTHLSQRATRMVALPKPTERELGEWYFQRYVQFLPSTGEWVLLNRSWYNRAGVERVMGFSTPAQQEQFLVDVPGFERMVVESGVTLVKYWLDVSREEQHRRLKDRRTDPLKTLKTSAMDEVAEKRFDDYSKARDEMLTRTHTPIAPWTCVRADDKKAARLNIMRHLLQALAYPKLSKKAGGPDPGVVFTFEADSLKDGRLAR